MYHHYSWSSEQTPIFPTSSRPATLRITPFWQTTKAFGPSDCLRYGSRRRLLAAGRRSSMLTERPLVAICMVSALVARQRDSWMNISTMRNRTRPEVAIKAWNTCMKEYRRHRALTELSSKVEVRRIRTRTFSLHKLTLNNATKCLVLEMAHSIIGAGYSIAKQITNIFRKYDT